MKKKIQFQLKNLNKKINSRLVITKVFWIYKSVRLIKRTFLLINNTNYYLSMEENLFVPHYLLLSRKTSDDVKKLKRKFKKRKIQHLFTYETYESNYEKESLKKLFNYLLSLKKKKIKDLIGFLTDDNVVYENINNIPPVPETWDILCLEADINQYNFKNQHNNIYWCNVIINDSRNFIINPNSLDNIMKIIYSSNSWFDFIKEINKLNIYCIAHMFLSENKNKYCVNSPNLEENSSLKSELFINKLITLENKKLLHQDKLIELFNSSNLDKHKSIFPEITLIGIYSNDNLFIHLLYTFLKIDYPKDKLKLIIIDDSNIDKRLKKMFFDDDRIKLINISNKNNSKFALGYKLNLALKYTTSQLVYHFFDTNIYYPSYFKDIVKCYLMSNTNAILSLDTGYCIHNKTQLTNQKLDFPDLANCLYDKRLWLTRQYDSTDDNIYSLLYNFIYFRQNCFNYLPFLKFSFKLRNEEEKLNNYEKSNLDFKKLIDPKIKESFELLLLDTSS